MLTSKELHRQIMHIIIGLITVGLIYFNIFRPFTIFLLLIVGILTSFLAKRIRLPVISTFLDIFERDEQMKKFPGRGVIFFFVGVLLVLQLFPLDIALASVMVLALGDSLSHIVGARYGEIKNIFNIRSPKLLEGTIVGAIAGFSGALIFVSIPEAFFGAFLAMVAEVVQIDLNNRQVDDNLIVPLVAGTAMVLVRFIL